MPTGDRILVVGSSNADIILNVPRNPHVGESLVVNHRVNGLGGKGTNRAVALSRLGANVQFCCKVGRDALGESILSAYEKENLSTELIFFDDRAGTGTAYVLVDESGNNTILSYLGANDTYSRQDMDQLIAVLPQFDYLSLELEISIGSVEELLHAASVRDVRVIVDAGPVRDIALQAFRGVFILSPNENEAAQLTGVEIVGERDARQACVKLYESGCKNVVLKRGAKGALLYDGDRFYDYPAYRNAGQPVDTTAAGDCFMAAMTFGLTRRMSLEEAIQYANVAAAISITRPGAIPSLPSRSEVDVMFAKSREEGYVR